MEELVERLKESKEPEDRLKVLLDLSERYQDENPNKAWEYSIMAYEMAEATTDKRFLAQASELIAKSLWRLSEYSDGIIRFQESLDHYLAISDFYGVARCYCGMGIISGEIEEYDVSLEYFELGLNAAKRAGKEVLSATLSGNIGHTLLQLGEQDKAIQQFEFALNYFEEVNDLQGVANMFGGIAGVKVSLGEYETALSMLSNAHTICLKLNNMRGVANTLLNMGIVLQKMGHHDYAQHKLQQALKHATAVNLKTLQQQIITNLIEVCNKLGETSLADEYFQLYEQYAFEERKQKAKDVNRSTQKLPH